jgi:hypothetical protein
MTTLTADEALARLRTWTSEPSEETRDALVTAALAFMDGSAGDGARYMLGEAAAKYRSEQREMAYQRSGFGCDIDAGTARQDLRESSEIVDLDDDDHGFSTLGAVMMRASGCHFAAKVPRLDNAWVGFGSSGRKAAQP